MRKLVFAIVLVAVGFFLRELKEEYIPQFDTWFKQHVQDKCEFQKNCSALQELLNGY